MSRNSALTRRILANDLRLFFRSFQRKSLGLAATIGLQGLIVAFLHFPAFTMMLTFGRSGVGGGAEFACLVVSMFILMTALQRCLEVLYNRGDLPLLLASPVPARAIVFTRLADILVTTALSTLLLVLPILDAAVVRFGAHWAWGWLAWLLTVMLLTPCSMLFTIVCVKRIGPRRTRTIAQTVGVLIGIVAYATMQAPSMMMGSGAFANRDVARMNVFSWFDVPPLRQFAAAAGGDPLWLAVLAVGSVAMAWLALRILSREFVAGAQASATDLGGPVRSAAESAVARPRAWRNAFKRGRRSVLLRKELLMVRRDPLLLVRCSTQVITLVPALAGAMLYRKEAGLAALASFAAAMVGVTLASLMTANDEAHEFLAASPLSRSHATMARAGAAAFLPALFGWILAAVLLVLGAPVVAAMTAIISTLNSVAFAWLGSCTVRPQPAEDHARNRPPKMLWQTLLAMLVGGLGGGAPTLWVAGFPMASVIMFAVALVIGALPFLARPRPAWEM